MDATDMDQELKLFFFFFLFFLFFRWQFVEHLTLF